ILIIAHRGASSLAPENTLKAFQKAIDLKADYIEFDVFESIDGELVITHDSDVSRITGHTGFVEKMTLKELRELDFGEGEKIPIFQDVIDLTKNEINLLIELKSKNIGEKIVRILRDIDLIDNTIISSFIFKELIKIKKLEPKLQFASLIPYEGTLYGNQKWQNWYIKRKAIDEASKNKFTFIHPFFFLVDDQFIEYAHQKNLKINVWTVDLKLKIKNLIKKGVDGIITNNVPIAKKVLKR
ncbi:MAG: glycerophosphodiester phosphodiesterase, partial [Promethearchaeota archaeon]